MSNDAIFWSNVQVDIQTALATALVISGITKANPGVVTYTGTDPANGDIVVLSIVGMHQLDKKVFRVANVNTVGKTFELDGEDTSGYETFSSGSAQVIATWASSGIIQDVNPSGGDPEFADTSVIHQLVRRRVPTVTSPMTIGFQALFSPSDPFYVEANRAHKTLTQRVVRLRFASGALILGQAYCAAAGVPGGSAHGVVQTSMSLEFQGLPTVYAS